MDGMKFTKARRRVLRELLFVDSAPWQRVGDTGSVVQTLRILQENGYVKTDAQGDRWSLTAKGREAAEQIIDGEGI